METNIKVHFFFFGLSENLFKNLQYILMEIQLLIKAKFNHPMKKVSFYWMSTLCHLWYCCTAEPPFNIAFACKTCNYITFIVTRGCDTRAHTHTVCAECWVYHDLMENVGWLLWHWSLIRFKSCGVYGSCCALWGRGDAGLNGSINRMKRKVVKDGGCAIYFGRDGTVWTN